MSTKSTFPAEFAPRVQIRDVETVNGGSRAVLSLQPQAGFSSTIAVARALIRRGAKPTVAKSVVERLVDGHPAPIVLKHFDGEALIAELAKAGVAAKPISEETTCLSAAVVETRKDMGLSQDQFANLLSLPVATLQNWEQARTKMDGPTRLLVSLITAAPQLAINLASLGFETVHAASRDRQPRATERSRAVAPAKAHG